MNAKHELNNYRDYPISIVKETDLFELEVFVRKTYRKTYGSFYRDTYGVYNGEVAIEERLIESFLPGIQESYTNKNSAIYICKDISQKEIVGYAVVETPENEDYFYLKHIYINNDFHRQGLGRMMLFQIFTDAKNNKRKVVKLVVLKTNEHAKNFYNRFDITFSGEETIYQFPQNTLVIGQWYQGSVEQSLKGIGFIV